MSCNPRPECPAIGDYLESPESPISFDADADVAGIGVILNFLISAWLTTAVATCIVLFVDDLLPEDKVNQTDQLIRRGIQTFFRPFKTHIPRVCVKVLKKLWPFHNRGVSRAGLQKICLMLADTQLITGASILVVMFSKHCQITQYHFAIGTMLAVVAFSAYGGTLTIVRSELRMSRFKRFWRLCWIFVFFACISAAMAVFSSQYFLQPYRIGLSTQCVWYLMNQGEGYTSAELRILLLQMLIYLYSFLSICANLFPEMKQSKGVSYAWRALIWLDHLSFRAYNRTKGWMERSPALAVLPHATTFALFVSGVTAKDIITSVIWEMCRIIAFLQLATRRLVRLRHDAADHGRVGNEDSWGFGQILPLLLLALPLFTLIEELIGTEKADDSRKALQQSKQDSSKLSVPYQDDDPFSDDNASTIRGHSSDEPSPGPSYRKSRDYDVLGIGHGGPGFPYAGQDLTSASGWPQHPAGSMAATGHTDLNRPQEAYTDSRRPMPTSEQRDMEMGLLGRRDSIAESQREENVDIAPLSQSERARRREKQVQKRIDQLYESGLFKGFQVASMMLVCGLTFLLFAI